MSDTFEKMDRMYRYQRYFYDLTRKYYLLGRDRLLAQMEIQPGEKILEIGYGTGRNIRILADRHRMACFYGIDASATMLESARKKLHKSGRSNINLERALADDFDFGIEFDKIFFSYSISMIPTWRESIDHALRNLKEGGTLYIVDFYDQANLPKSFRRFLKWWLEQFHVCHAQGLIPYLEMLETAGSGGLTVTPLFRRYSFIAVFRKPAS
jgi:S-adenosylmethionine-diacylgycerolhomoserine-N-methlytransferase